MNMMDNGIPMYGWIFFSLVGLVIVAGVVSSVVAMCLSVKHHNDNHKADLKNKTDVIQTLLHQSNIKTLLQSGIDPAQAIMATLVGANSQPSVVPMAATVPTAPAKQRRLGFIVMNSLLGLIAVILLIKFVF